MYLAEEIVRSIKTGKTKPYSSNTSMKESVKVQVDKVKVKLPKNKPSVAIPTPKFKTSDKLSLSALQTLLDAYLVKRVKENMQTETQYNMGSS
jgi:hypothetical protein